MNLKISRITGAITRKVIRKRGTLEQKPTTIVGSEIQEIIIWKRIMTKNTVGVKLVDGKDIHLEKGERLSTFKNKFTGEIVYSTSKYTTQNINGKDFIPVFKKPFNPKERRINLIAMDAIEHLKV